MTKSTLEILIKARKVIENPENWTQGVLARDGDGMEVPVTSETATCFCALGAILKVADYSVYRERAWDALHDKVGGEVDEFNDAHTHKEVLELFDRAISKARG